MPCLALTQCGLCDSFLFKVSLRFQFIIAYAMACCPVAPSEDTGEGSGCPERQSITSLRKTAKATRPDKCRKFWELLSRARARARVEVIGGGCCALFDGFQDGGGGEKGEGRAREGKSSLWLSTRPVEPCLWASYQMQGRCHLKRVGHLHPVAFRFKNSRAEEDDAKRLKRQSQTTHNFRLLEYLKTIRDECYTYLPFFFFGGGGFPAGPLCESRISVRRGCQPEIQFLGGGPAG